MTFAELLLDERTQFFWAARIYALGYDLYVAEEDVQIGSRLYQGCMVVERPPGLDADPYTGRASAGSCRLRLTANVEDLRVAGSLRTMDLEAVAGVPWTDATVVLDLYAIDPDRTALQAATGAGLYADSRGTYKVDGYQLEGSGELVLDCVGLAERYNVKLPAYVIDKKTWTNCYAEDRGRKASILYGTFNNLEAPQVDTVNERCLVACHHLTSRSGSRVDDMSAPSTLVNTTDTKGRPVALFDFAGDLGDALVVAAGAGHPDDASGTYTGTPSALISHPADQLRHFAEAFAGIPSNMVDVGSFHYLRAVLPGWAWSLMLTPDDDYSFFDTIQDTCRLLRIAVLFERGYLRVAHCRLDAPNVLNLVDGENCEDVVIQSGDESRIINAVTLKYNYGWRRKRKIFGFREVVRLDDSDHAGAALSLARHGLKREQIETRSIIGDAAGDAAAHAVATGILDLACTRRRTATCLAKLESHLLRIYDVVRLTTDKMPSISAGMTTTRWIVTGINYDRRTNQLTLLEC